MRYTEFNGKRYWRDKNGYYRRQGLILHREIWKVHYGEIPDGYHIHHLDKNKENNHISNLQCILRSEHHKLHGSEPKSKEWARKLCEMIRPLSKEWHSSQQGKKWHISHAKEMNLGNWDPRNIQCEMCSNIYQTTKRSKSRFCSNSCKSAWRREEGVDNETRQCKVCEAPFVVNKYAKTNCCSKSCGSKMRENKKHSQS